MPGQIDTPAPTPGLAPWPRRLVSAWLLFHVLAIVIAPASIQPSSGLIRDIWWICRPYLQGLYLNHGYHYFAPQPPEWSNLVEFSVTRPDGSTRTEVIPHRSIRPRQLYHRHFMLTESLGYVPEELHEQWFSSFAAHMCEELRADEVTLRHLVHYVPSLEMVLDGVNLDNPESFVVTELGVYRRRERTWTWAEGASPEERRAREAAESAEAAGSAAVEEVNEAAEGRATGDSP
jgi:hypothetical protein